MSRTFVIAEAGVNHNGDRALAFELVEAAAQAGADAVKFQTFSAERLAVPAAPKAEYQKRSTDAGESQLEMLRKLELPEEWHFDLRDHAKALGIEFLSTAFDRQSLDFLETLALPRYKIPSGELTNGPLLWRFARTHKPLILSTGMSTLAEVEQALAVLGHGMIHSTAPTGLDEVWRGYGNDDVQAALRGCVTLLHCTSQYPCPTEEVNLRAMDTLSAAFDLPVGYSDHTDGTTVPIGAVAKGATVIEKHFTLDRSLPGPDHRASLEPDELAKMVAVIRDIEQALGDGIKRPQASEWGTRRVARQVLVAETAIEAGTRFTERNLGTRRAGEGVSAAEYWDWLGRVAQRPYRAGEVIRP